MRRPDALDLANEVDQRWHGQARSFEREAVTRFWGLLTLPARALDPLRPRALLRGSVVLRNARFFGSPVKNMFFANKDFTEVDALFLQVGSSLGHLSGDDAWVVEVERKTGNQQGDYYLAVQRARKFAELLSQQFQIRARPVVIYEDEGGKFSYPAYEGDGVLIPITALRERTVGLSFPAIEDIPGLASDRTLVQLSLIRALASGDPHRPGWFDGPRPLARAIEEASGALHLPVVGHQDAGAFPESLSRWLGAEREDDAHLFERIDRYLDELQVAGMLESRHPPRLSMAGGQIALRLLQAESEEPR